SKSRVSHQVARMESRGLLQRQGCPSDARGSFAALTPAGLAEVAAAAPSHVRSVRRHLIDRLTPDEVAELAAVTERIIAHLEALAPGGTRPCPGSGSPWPGEAAGAPV
ncbi:MAG: MarR family winged helix-turn-helix transcriptional regulator, partial [Acidimicrobiales bacterium]